MNPGRINPEIAELHKQIAIERESRCKEIITEEHKRYQYQSNINTSNKIRSGKAAKK